MSVNNNKIKFFPFKSNVRKTTLTFQIIKDPLLRIPISKISSINSNDQLSIVLM